jgi:hypothetical protein
MRRWPPGVRGSQPAQRSGRPQPAQGVFNWLAQWAHTTQSLSIGRRQEGQALIECSSDRIASCSSWRSYACCTVSAGRSTM